MLEQSAAAAPAAQSIGAARLRKDLIAAGLLAATVLLFLGPLVVGWAPAIFDDCSIETLPGLIATARTIQRGALPLWDFCTCAGGKPPYADNAYQAFYLPMYPFFLLADVDNPSQCHRLLMMVPLAIHLVWAAWGAYCFGRLVLRLHPAGAWLAGLLYGLSPDMGFQLVSTPVAATLSHLPWCSLALVRFFQTGRLRWWVGGTLLLALMSSSGNPNYLIRAYFVMAATVALLWGACLWQQRRQGGTGAGSGQGGRWHRWRLHRLFGTAAMMALSITLSGPAWAGTIEAATLIEDAAPLTAENVAWFDPFSSMHPLNLITLFVPGFFGVLEGRHPWGVGTTLSSHSSLPGGMFLMLAVLGAAGYWWRRTGGGAEQQRTQRWAWIAGLLLVGSLLAMMGGYTPAFSLLCAVLPWFFRFPHPVYYRFAACWSIALLDGIGVSTLVQAAAEQKPSTVWRRVARLAWAAAIAGTLVALWLPSPADGWDGQRWMSGFDSLGAFEQWSWFLTRPIAYFLTATVLLLILLRCCRCRALARWVLAVATCETLYVAWAVFYGTPYLGLQVRLGQTFTPIWSHYPERRRSLERDPHFEAVPVMRELWREQPGRCIGACSIFDNVAWYLDGRALMGYSAKPLLPWYRRVVGRFSRGGSQLVISHIPHRLLQNMNVRYFLASKLREPIEGIEPIRETAHFSICRLKAAPLPYAYLQDRVLVADREAQLQAIFTEDLRGGVFVTPEDAKRLSGAARTAARSVPPDGAQRFEAFQQANSVVSVDQSRPNRVRLSVMVHQPAMLVLSECWHPGWHARADGRPARVYRVNYLMQGIWLQPGVREVELRFFPPALQWGLVASGLSLLVLVAVPLGIALRNAKMR